MDSTFKYAASQATSSNRRRVYLLRLDRGAKRHRGLERYNQVQGGAERGEDEEDS